MTFFGRARRCAIGVVLGLSLSGCFPPADNQLDEKKDPNFIAGKNLVNQMDWPGAIEAFEKALDANPHSASAHFELGWLCEEKVSDPAAAIYHYDRYLKLSANPDKVDLVRQQINSCKLELVKNVSAVGPSPSGAQRELERVLAENKDLQTQVAQLQAQLAQARTAAATSRSVVQVPAVNPIPVKSIVEPTRAETSRVALSQTSVTTPKRIYNTGTTTTHLVKSHETLAAIARQHGVSLAALESANPQIRPEHLLVGQTLKVPAP